MVRVIPEGLAQWFKVATNSPSAEFIARAGSVFSGVRELASSLDDIAVHVTVQVRVKSLRQAADACTMPTFSEHGFEHSNGRSYTLSAESPDQPIAQAVEPGCRFDIESGKAFGSARNTIIRTHATCQKQPRQAHEKAAQARSYKATAQARRTRLPALQEADGDQGRPHRPECRRVLGVRGVSEMPGDSADLSLGVRPGQTPLNTRKR